jgi:hypothetical protein
MLQKKKKKKKETSVQQKVDRNNPTRTKEEDENIIPSYIAVNVFNIRFEIINLQVLYIKLIVTRKRFTYVQAF